MAALSRKVAAKHAMEMLLTGDPRPAARAAEIGLVNYVAADQLTGKVMEMAQKIASKSTATVGFGNRPSTDSWSVRLSSSGAAVDKVTNMLARDAEEGIAAFIEKRHPELDRQLNLQPGPDSRIISVPA